MTCVNGLVTSSFTYGADGLRRQITANGATTDYVLDNGLRLLTDMFVRERNHATGAAIATYLVGTRGPEYRRDDIAGTVRWYLYDGLGSVLGEVDPNGSVTSSRKYDVYGAVRGGNNPGGSSRHKFVGSLGHPSDDETGLVYMRARYYDPAVGRFVSEDARAVGDNWFSYCSENPINQLDETGNVPAWPFQWLGRLVINLIFLFVILVVSAIMDACKADPLKKGIVLGLIAAVGSATAGQFGPVLFKNFVDFLNRSKEAEIEAAALPGGETAIKAAETEGTVLEAELAVEDIEQGGIDLNLLK